VARATRKVQTSTMVIATHNTSWSPSPYDAPFAAIQMAVEAAIAEDTLPLGDISVTHLNAAETSSFAIATRSDGVFAGSAVAAHALFLLVPEAAVLWMARDGQKLNAGEHVCHVTGPIPRLLTAERTVLNFLSHLSGVATLTNKFVQQVSHGIGIRDTRKTIPGLRALQKAAVRAGGGVNHRGSLSEAILVKDNHLANAGIGGTVSSIAEFWPGRQVQLECETYDDVQAAVSSRVDSLLLDNMSPEEVARAVALAAGHVRVIEVSGGITLDNVAQYSIPGVDFISVGAITHSVLALDFGLDALPG
jgi:nicotinate-nucleotide pyrophosphorylase (carboxylating)